MPEKALFDYLRQRGPGGPALCSPTVSATPTTTSVGGQAKAFPAGLVRTRIAVPDYPTMKGFKPFESWEDTDVRTQWNEKGRDVLEKWDNEPWT